MSSGCSQRRLECRFRLNPKEDSFHEIDSPHRGGWRLPVRSGARRHARPGSFPTVTLYGLIDTGLQYVSNGPGGHSKTGISTGNLSGSRWGLRGSEDLGGGLSAIFTLENGFDSSNGQAMQGDRLFGRQAYVACPARTGAASRWAATTR